MARGLDDVLCDPGRVPAGVHDGEDSLLVVVFLDRLNLLVVGLELLPESLLRVVLALPVEMRI